MRTELEKMLAGELYNVNDSFLSQAHDKARHICQEFNNELDGQKRSVLLKQLFGKTGQKIHMEANLRVDYGFNVSIIKCENFFANYDCIILDTCKVSIGDNCLFGPVVHVYSAMHPIDPDLRNSTLGGGGKPVTIGNNVWVGGMTVINPGVTLGDNVVVGSGSVITKSFPDVVIAGNPARIIREIKKN